jgi:hypothetical protein
MIRRRVDTLEILTHHVESPHDADHAAVGVHHRQGEQIVFDE